MLNPRGLHSLKDISVIMITLNFTDLVKQRTINLWNKNLSDADLDVVVGVLKQSTVLHFLRLPGNNLTLADGTKHVANALKVNKTLKHLFLHYNYIGDGGAKLIADALIENESLEQLGLYGNSIGVDGAKHLANALKVNKSLEIISLSRNKHIGVEGAKHIANALKVNNTLKELSLCSSKTGVDGAKHIADALIENESLEILSLMGNNVGDEGAKSIADCFYKNQCLRRVELGRNNIGDDGAKKLAEALRWNHGIKWLTIDYDPVSQHIRSEIGEILNEPGRKVPNAQARHLQEVIACKDETIASKNNLIHIKDQELNNQVEVIKGKDTTIEKKNGEIESLKKAMAMIYKQNHKANIKLGIIHPMPEM